MCSTWQQIQGRDGRCPREIYAGAEDEASSLAGYGGNPAPPWVNEREMALHFPSRERLPTPFPSHHLLPSNGHANTQMLAHA